MTSGQGCLLSSPGLARELRASAGPSLAKHHGENQLLLQHHLGHHLDQTPRGPLQHHLPGHPSGAAVASDHHIPLHLLSLLLEPVRQEWPTAKPKQGEKEEEEEEEG